MKTIKFPILCGALASAAILFNQPASAQNRTAAITPADLEVFYTTSIEDRTSEILKPLGLTDTGKSNQLHEIIVAQYRVMRARDALINAQLEAEGKAPNYANRASRLESESASIHAYFLANLSKLLTPEQVEQVKDKMTYNKVKVTYDAYAVIIPGLTDSDKAKILELLKEAREKAMDAGSSTEKSDVFQIYKNKVNDYLNAHGHDVAKAYKDWEAKQAVAKNQAAGSTTTTTTNTAQ